MNPPTLYQRVLGSNFSKLPPILQQFHGQPRGGHATGTIVVERNTGILHHVAAGVLRLPGASENMPLRLQVVPHNSKELWIRHFGQQCLETLQWQEGPYLVEKAGPVQLAFQLTADEQGLTFHLHHNKTWGIKLPSGLSLRVAANACGAENHWHIEVVISVPILGTITTYRGEIVPQSPG